MGKTDSPFGLPKTTLPKGLRPPSVRELMNQTPKMPGLILNAEHPRILRKTQLPSGPKRYHLQRKPAILSGPGDPPKGFINAANSIDEWYVYWALRRIKGPEGYQNGWLYQDPVLGGRHLPGGSVLDFLIVDQTPRIAIRVQTEHFHVTAGVGKIVSDRERRVALEQAGFSVADIYSQDFIHDPTGKAVLKTVTQVLNGSYPRNPLQTGNVLAHG